MFRNSGLAKLGQFAISLRCTSDLDLQFGHSRRVSTEAAAGPVGGAGGNGPYLRRAVVTGFATCNSILRLRSAIDTLAYCSMVAMRILSPYLFAALLVALQPSVGHAAAPAEIFVQQNIDEGYTILNDGTLSAPERGEKLHALLLRIIDGKRIALFTLGVYARDSS